jgi:hypothetical protein
MNSRDRQCDPTHAFCCRLSSKPSHLCSWSADWRPWPARYPVAAEAPSPTSRGVAQRGRRWSALTPGTFLESGVAVKIVVRKKVHDIDKTLNDHVKLITP